MNLDFTKKTVTQESKSNQGDTNKADEERSRPNYITGKFCRKDGGCTPCDKNFTNPKKDGCLVATKTGAQEWFGMTTTDGSDLLSSSSDVELKCNHTGQKVPIHFYAEDVKNAQVSLFVNDEAQNLTSMQHTQPFHAHPRGCVALCE